jgi:hypothetical protein
MLSEYQLDDVMSDEDVQRCVWPYPESALPQEDDEEISTKTKRQRTVPDAHTQLKEEKLKRLRTEHARLTADRSMLAQEKTVLKRVFATLLQSLSDIGHAFEGVLHEDTLKEYMPSLIVMDECLATDNMERAANLIDESDGHFALTTTEICKQSVNHLIKTSAPGWVEESRQKLNTALSTVTEICEQSAVMMNKPCTECEEKTEIISNLKAVVIENHASMKEALDVVTSPDMGKMMNELSNKASMYQGEAARLKKQATAQEGVIDRQKKMIDALRKTVTVPIAQEDCANCQKLLDTYTWKIAQLTDKNQRRLENEEKLFKDTEARLNEHIKIKDDQIASLRQRNRTSELTKSRNDEDAEKTRAAMTHMEERYTSQISRQSKLISDLTTQLKEANCPVSISEDHEVNTLAFQILINLLNAQGLPSAIEKYCEDIKLFAWQFNRGETSTLDQIADLLKTKVNGRPVGTHIVAHFTKCSPLHRYVDAFEPIFEMYTRMAAAFTKNSTREDVSNHFYKDRATRLHIAAMNAINARKKGQLTNAHIKAVSNKLQEKVGVYRFANWIQEVAIGCVNVNTYLSEEANKRVEELEAANATMAQNVRAEVAELLRAVEKGEVYVYQEEGDAAAFETIRSWLKTIEHPVAVNKALNQIEVAGAFKDVTV